MQFACAHDKSNLNKMLRFFTDNVISNRGEAEDRWTKSLPCKVLAPASSSSLHIRVRSSSNYVERDECYYALSLEEMKRIA